MQTARTVAFQLATQGTPVVPQRLVILIQAVQMEVTHSTVEKATTTIPALVKELADEATQAVLAEVTELCVTHMNAALRPLVMTWASDARAVLAGASWSAEQRADDAVHVPPVQRATASSSAMDESIPREVRHMTALLLLFVRCVVIPRLITILCPLG